MKPEELREMAELWERNLSRRQIARLMGYSESWIDEVMRNNRAMFPKHKKPHYGVGKAKREMWVARIQAGRSTARRASLALGVRYDTVIKWLNEAERKNL